MLVSLVSVGVGSLIVGIIVLGWCWWLSVSLFLVGVGGC